MEDVYLHLYSGDSLKAHSDNHAGDFVVDLPKRFLLEGTWECALTELALPSQPERQTHRLYVCADVVEESYARNSFLPLLRSTEPVEEGTLEYAKPYYVRLRQTDLNRVRIFIRDDQLRACRFKTDGLHCTLHLRRRRWGR